MMKDLSIGKTCAICKHANHDPSLGDREEIICVLKPSSPQLKPTNDTCLSHESKYRNLKIIEDKGTLFEYDSGTKSDKEVTEEEYEQDFLEEEIKTEETGEEEVSWQL